MPLLHTGNLARNGKILAVGTYAGDGVSQILVGIRHHEISFGIDVVGCEFKRTFGMSYDNLEVAYIHCINRSLVD